MLAAARVGLFKLYLSTQLHRSIHVHLLVTCTIAQEHARHKHMPMDASVQLCAQVELDQGNRSFDMCFG